MKKMNICIAGLGNVGSSLIETINQTNKYIESKSSLSFNIVGISAKNRNKVRVFDVNKYKWFDNCLDLAGVENCNVLIELIGQEKGLSFELIKKALENKINVVTANKALLAKNGSDLFKIAEKNNVLFLYEAAVAGGIPIVKTIKNNIFLNKIKKISGILNGTTNFILTQMFENNISFNDALSKAKSKGYTSETEAELDIGGLDSSHKLTILSTLCFGSKINYLNNDTVGIYDISINDIIFANKLGYKIKLISESSIINNQIFSTTTPKLLPVNNPLANVDGVLNAIKIETDQLESLFLEGEGAGGKATASSVISDLYEIASNSNIPSLGYLNSSLIDFDKFDILNFESPYYLRIMTKDIAGVLSQITGFFKDFDISIEKILQLPDDDLKDKPVPIIIITHTINKNKLMKSVAQIESKDFVLEKISVIPIDKK